MYARSALQVQERFQLFSIRGVTQSFADWYHEEDLGLFEAQCLFENEQDQSRALVSVREFDDGHTETYWHRAWLPDSGWHHDALKDWVHNSAPNVRGSITTALAFKAEPDEELKSGELGSNAV